jgi:hypothetical protein
MNGDRVLVVVSAAQLAAAMALIGLRGGPPA